MLDSVARKLVSKLLVSCFIDHWWNLRDQDARAIAHVKPVHSSLFVLSSSYGRSTGEFRCSSHSSASSPNASGMYQMPVVMGETDAVRRERD